MYDPDVLELDCINRTLKVDLPSLGVQGRSCHGRRSAQDVASAGRETIRVLTGSTRLKAGTAEKLVLQHAEHRCYGPARISLR